MSLTLLSFLGQTAVISVIAELMLLSVRRKSAALRHCISIAGLEAVIMLSLILLFGTDHSEAPHAFQTTIQDRVIAGAKVQPGQPMVPSPSGKGETLLTPAKTDGVSVFKVAFVIWAIGASMLTARLLVSFILLGALIRRTKRFGDGSDAQLRLDPAGSVPVTAWWGRNIVLLPPAADQWPPDRLQTVLCHERAHIRRGDWWWNISGQIACAIAWPNPFVWLLQRQSRDLSELAVDDLVLDSGIPASKYAEDLLQIAVNRFSPMGNLALPMAIKPRLSRRIEMLLNKEQIRGTASFTAMFGILVVQAGIVGAASGWSVALKPSTQNPSIRKRESKIVMHEKWYLLDSKADAMEKATGDPMQLHQVEPEVLNKLLKERNGRLVASPETYRIVPRLSQPKNELAEIAPKDVVFKLKIATSGSKPPISYAEGVVADPGMFEFKLEGAERVSNTRTCWVSTISEGPSTLDWIAKDARPICLFAPPVDSKQLLIVHTFERI